MTDAPERIWTKPDGFGVGQRYQSSEYGDWTVGYIRADIAAPQWQPIETAPDLLGFAKQIMQAWPHGDVDGFELQDAAVKHGLLVKVPGGFDPERHNDFYGCSEKGDDWFKYAPEISGHAAPEAGQ